MTNDEVNTLQMVTRLREAKQYHLATLLLEQLRDNSTLPDEAATFALMEVNCLTLSGDLVRARNIVNRLASVKSTDEIISFFLEHETARLERAEGKRKAALKRTNRILERFKSLLSHAEYRERAHELKAERAMLLAGVGDLEVALAELEESRSVSPERPDIQYYLGKTCFLLGRYSSAIEWLLGALSDPELDSCLNIHAQYILAYSYYRIGSYARAINTLEVLQGLSPERVVPLGSIHEMLCDSYRKMGVEPKSCRSATSGTHKQP